MAPSPRPVSLTQSATNTAAGKPRPLQVVGPVPVAASQVKTLTAVPATFADVAAVQTYLATLVAGLKSSDYFD